MRTFFLCVFEELEHGCWNLITGFHQRVGKKLADRLYFFRVKNGLCDNTTGARVIVLTGDSYQKGIDRPIFLAPILSRYKGALQSTIVRYR